MERLISIFCLVSYGFTDSLKGSGLAIKFFWKDRKKVNPTTSTLHQGKRRTLFEVLVLCLVFGVIYMSAMFAFEYLVKWYLIKYLTSFLAPDEEYYYQLFSSICYSQFTLCWTIPLFLLSRILSYSWFQDVSDLTCAQVGIKPTKQQSLSYALSDQINSALTESLFLAQAYVVYLLPLNAIIQASVNIFHLSLLYALYAFEYKWVQKGLDMNWRLAYVEAKWPYFVAYGFPLSILTFAVSSYFPSICLFSTFFPLYVLGSTISCTARLKSFNHPLYVFKIVTIISDFFVSSLIVKVFKFIR